MQSALAITWLVSGAKKRPQHEALGPKRTQSGRPDLNRGPPAPKAVDEDLTPIDRNCFTPLFPL